MATFLQLCQDVSRESGTISGTSPTTVVDQTGRPKKVVEWTAEAWTQIQNHRDSWRWMRREFTGTLTASTARYTGASFTDRVSGSAITRLREWITEPGTMTIYTVAEGVSYEGELSAIGWATWRERYRRGTQTEDKPVEYAISPQNELCFGPTPDEACTVNGEFMRSPQILSANDDTPEMPSQFHALIKWWAITLLAQHDEAPWPKQEAGRQVAKYLADLERSQLPKIGFSDEVPLA